MVELLRTLPAIKIQRISRDFLIIRRKSLSDDPSDGESKEPSGQQPSIPTKCPRVKCKTPVEEAPLSGTPSHQEVKEGGRKVVSARPPSSG